jgi:protein-L-isoaspartate(D-aspartate) O-methyltransferase
MNHDYRADRDRMIQDQLISRGIRDPRVLQAMAKVPRHRFVGDDLKSEAYEDHPLPIGYEQTISQPYIVAYMTEALELTNTERVLEIGTGSGYQTAILAELSKEVYSIERVEALLLMAKQALAELGYTNICFKVFDGTLGWKDRGPFDAIVVTAAAPTIPQPLLEQLSDSGRLIIPVGAKVSQELVKIRKKDGNFIREELGGVRFVSLVGAYGWSE